MQHVDIDLKTVKFYSGHSKMYKPIKNHKSKILKKSIFSYSKIEFINENKIKVEVGNQILMAN